MHDSVAISWGRCWGHCLLMPFFLTPAPTSRSRCIRLRQLRVRLLELFLLVSVCAGTSTVGLGPPTAEFIIAALRRPPHILTCSTIIKLRVLHRRVTLIVLTHHHPGLAHPDRITAPVHQPLLFTLRLLLLEFSELCHPVQMWPPQLDGEAYKR